jgi:dTDP-4-amino-4,6-dideoxy-D-galactose acyltransferase
MPYQMLDWDSELLNLAVARIDDPAINAQELLVSLSELKQKHVRLVYWSSDKECNDEILKRFSGILADRKTTFVIDLRTVDFSLCVPFDDVEPYTPGMPISDIHDLAIQSGEHSRFAVDPNIPRDRFIALYNIWMTRSLGKEIAGEVLVIREGNRVVGMVTLGEKKGRGDIGLIAVDRNSRGKKYGEKLVRASQQWFVKHGYEFGQVVTQGTNISACNLYRKCGYSVEKVEYFYHFWL